MVTPPTAFLMRTSLPGLLAVICPVMQNKPVANVSVVGLLSEKVMLRYVPGVIVMLALTFTSVPGNPLLQAADEGAAKDASGSVMVGAPMLKQLQFPLHVPCTSTSFAVIVPPFTMFVLSMRSQLGMETMELPIVNPVAVGPSAMMQCGPGLLPATARAPGVADVHPRMRPKNVPVASDRM